MNDSTKVQETTATVDLPKPRPSSLSGFPTNSTTATLHYASSTPNLQRISIAKSEDTDTDVDTYWRSSTSVETATAIPQPTFTSSAVRLTLTRPLIIRTHSSQSYLHSRSSVPNSPLDSSPAEKIERDNREEKDLRTRRRLLNRGSHGTNPLGSHPPNPRDTIRYSVVSISAGTAGPRGTEGEKKEQQQQQQKKKRDLKSKLMITLRRRWGLVKEKCSSCFRVDWIDRRK